MTRIVSICIRMIITGMPIEYIRLALDKTNRPKDSKVIACDHVPTQMFSTGVIKV